MSTPRQILCDDIVVLAKLLRLSNFAQSCPEAIHRAQIDRPTYLEFIHGILSTEVEERQKRDLQRRMQQAKLPRNCDLDRFDFNHSAGITKPQLRQLRELVWLDQAYNIILMGPSGVGKTLILSGLIRDAVLKGYRAQFLTMETLIGILRMKDVSSSAMSAYGKLLRLNLLGIDDIMLFPMKKEESVAFFNLINSLHEKVSVIITTNKAPTEWVEILQDEVLATALLDRLLFRCDVVKLSGSSYRMEHRGGFLTQTEEGKEGGQ
ncbi:MAG: ATP-binding protein [Bacteroidaceae bacterium]|nr:ATP-binding protein [Bacteroidaceae bacterium]